MRRPIWLALTSVSLLAGWIFAPTAAADRFRFPSSPLTGEPAIPVHPDARPMIPNAASDSSIPQTRIRGGRSSSRGVPGGVLVAPPVYYGPVVSTVDQPAPPLVVEPPVAATPPVTINIVTPAQAAPPPAPPDRGVIEYSNGRFELRGDGEGKPYRWVWIPNPPQAPPSSAADSGLYGWVDERGAMHVTDRWESIPAQYREQAKRNKGS